MVIICQKCLIILKISLWDMESYFIVDDMRSYILEIGIWMNQDMFFYVENGMNENMMIGVLMVEVMSLGEEIGKEDMIEGWLQIERSFYLEGMLILFMNNGSEEGIQSWWWVFDLVLYQSEMLICYQRYDVLYFVGFVLDLGN